MLMSAVAADSLKFSDFSIRNTLPGNGWVVGYDSSNGLKYNVRYPNSVLQGRLIPGTGIVLSGNVISAPGGGTGPAGPQGPQGIQGPAGPQGPSGSGSGGSSFDTTNQQVYNAVKKIAQDNAVPVDYFVDGDYGFDRIEGKLYIKGMHFFPSVATAYGSATLDPFSSNAAGKITFTSNGTAIPVDGVICTVTFVTTTYLFTPFVQPYPVGSASAGQALYPAAESINSFQIRIKTGFSPANGAVLYYGFRTSPSSNVSAQ